MLHLQLRVPPELTEKVVEILIRDDTVTNVAVFENGYSKPPGTLVLADVAREGANPVIAALRELNLQHAGSITVQVSVVELGETAFALDRERRLVAGASKLTVRWCRSAPFSRVLPEASPRVDSCRLRPRWPFTLCSFWASRCWERS